MDNEILKTSVDDLHELVRSREKISVEDAAKLLKLPVNIAQSLVDFLVEESIFGIEYKFTTPYIYLSHKKKKDINLQKQFKKKLVTKEEFFKKASNWNAPFEKINDLWESYIQENLSSIKEEFYIKAHTRNFPKDKIDALWKKYLTYL